MTPTVTDPITVDWTSYPSAPTMPPSAHVDHVFSDQPTARADSTASDVSALLARIEVSDLDEATVPLLAAAAAELALVAGISWRLSSDDPAVALLRLVARATLICPDGAGPHTTRLAEHLTRDGIA